MKTKLISLILAVLACLALLAIAPANLRAAFILNTSDSQFDTGVDNQGWWSATEGNQDGNDVVRFEDADASRYPVRYYRAVSQ